MLDTFSRKARCPPSLCRRPVQPHLGPQCSSSHTQLLLTHPHQTLWEADAWPAGDVSRASLSWGLHCNH